jgi:8-oxo-dGTP pyrophosphatase MutT (NUDIX family)
VTIEPPGFDEARRPHGPRDPGDAWVVAPTGERYWGRFGAAGLLAIDAERGVLLQHRVSWSHFGDTWALPGGARHEGESACDGALREAAEEAGVPDAAVRPRVLSVFDLGYWSYTTVVGDVVIPFEPTISDPESRELAWVPAAAITDYPLHPGFAASWERLRGLLDVRPAVIVDVANVMGAVPDGWWRDRAAAATRLVARMSELAARGVAASVLDLPEQIWYPEWTAVVEGQARSAGDAPGIEVVRAEASGDDAVVVAAERAVANARTVTVVTSDRGLAERVTVPTPPPGAAGASPGASGRVGAAGVVTVRGARWLLDLLEG